MAKYPCTECRKDISATKNDRYRSHTDGDGEPCVMASVEIPQHILDAGPLDAKSDPGVPVEGVDFAVCPQCTRKVKLTRLGYFEPHDETLRGGDRWSMPGDYVFDSPALLGRQRLGPDLHDVGSRLEDQNDVLAHLYQPRAFQASSVMPSYRYLFDLKPTTSVLPSETVVTVDTTVAPAEGYSIVAREEAIALSAYLASLTLN
jgi:hypothetical protein